MKPKKSNLSALDYLLIPTGWTRQRKKRALEEIKKREIRNILILNGNDSEEDILYLGKRIKKGDKIGIVTFPLHFQEYKELIKKAQKERKFPKRIKIENIQTKQTLKQFIYGRLGLIEERLDQEVNYTKEEHENPLKYKLKKVIKKILG
jgi:hypothetical protein